MKLYATAKEIGRFLEDEVRAKGINAVIAYNKLARQFDLPDVDERWQQHPLCKIFDDLDKEDAGKKRPFRTVLVISQEKGRPGQGFYKTIANLRTSSLHAVSDTEKQKLFDKELQSLVQFYGPKKSPNNSSALKIFLPIITIVTLYFGAVQRIDAQSILTTNFDGGSVTNFDDEVLLPEIRLNANSTLHRSWYVLNDQSCPFQLNETGIGVSPMGNQYIFIPHGTAKITQKTQAVEVRFIIYDAFGEYLKTLSWSELKDIEIADSYDLFPVSVGFNWGCHENEASSFLTSVAFVAQIRTADGKLWRYNQKAISDELVRLQLKVADVDYSPKK